MEPVKINADDKPQPRVVTGKIYEKIPLVMADIKAVSKGQYNKQQGFRFRGIDDIYNSCQKVLAKHRVFTAPEIIGRFREAVSTKSGNRAYLVVNNYKFRFYAEDGSFVEAWADGEAIDTGDKASNKAAAIAHKYALLQVFCIPTDDLEDPDSVSPELGMPGENKGSSRPPMKFEQHGPRVMGDPDKPASQKQVNMIYNERIKHGLDEGDVVRHIFQTYNVHSVQHLTNGQIQELKQWITEH